MSLPKQFVDAGARRTSAAAPEVITLEWLQGECDRLERILRLQYPDGKLSPEDELALDQWKPAMDTTRGMRLWAQLKHLYLCRTERRRSAAEVDASDTITRLLTRTPVVTHLCGHRVEVTGRSYSVLAEMAAHGLRRDMLQDDAGRLAEIAAGLRAELRRRVRGRGRLRARLRKIEALHRRALTERELHRRAIYAHALTPHGGPARDVVAEAPDWWREIGPAEEAELLRAMHEAGPGRYVALGEPPRRPAPKGKPRRPAEDFGIANLLAAWGIRLRMRPAALFDVDLGQLLAEMRAGSDATSDDLVEELA